MTVTTDTHRHTQSGTHAKTQTRRCRAAFTLMELLVVIAIMAVISTIAVGGYFGMIRAAAYSSAHDNVYNTLSLARQRAVIDGKVTSVMILNATNYVVVRAIGRISHVDNDVAHDAYTDLSGAVTPTGKKIGIYNLDAEDSKKGVVKQVRIEDAALGLTDPTDGSGFNVKGYRFAGAGKDFFVVGDRYGFALHSQQSLPRGYLFANSPQEVRFKNDGSCVTEITITVTEKIRPANDINLTIDTSGAIEDNSKVNK